MGILKYEERLIAFIDIIGFKHLVINGEEEKIQYIVDVFNEECKLNKKEGNNSAEIEATWFSDSLVISYRINEKNYHLGLIRLAEQLSYVQSILFFKGVLCRGGISLGELHHTGVEVIGKAMLDAYSIESDKSHREPLIRIKKENFDKLTDVDDDDYTKDLAWSYFAEHADSNYYFINFLENDLNDSGTERYDLVNTYKNEIRKKLDSNLPEDVLKKYKWLESHINTIVNKRTK